MERTVTLKDKKMIDLIRQKEGLVMEGRSLTTEIEKLEKDRMKVGLKIQKVKDKLAPLVEKQDYGLGGFEYLHKIDLKGDEVVVTIRDQVEEYKEAVRAKKKQ